MTAVMKRKKILMVIKLLHESNKNNKMKKYLILLLPHQPSLKQQQYHYPNADGAVCDIENGRKQGLYFASPKWKPIWKMDILGDVDHVHHIAH